MDRGPRGKRTRYGTVEREGGWCRTSACTSNARGLACAARHTPPRVWLTSLLPSGRADDRYRRLILDYFQWSEHSALRLSLSRPSSSHSLAPSPFRSPFFRLFPSLHLSFTPQQKIGILLADRCGRFSAEFRHRAREASSPDERAPATSGKLAEAWPAAGPELFLFPRPSFG